MTTRTARCFCGDFQLQLEGEPFFVSSCCCSRCQRRTGSFFGVTSYWRPAQLVKRTGTSSTFKREDATTTFHFCPRCGSSLLWIPDSEDTVIGVAGGAFVDATLPAPGRMVYTANKHPFVCVPPGVPEFADAPDDVD